MKRKSKVIKGVPVTQSVVESVAQIMGPYSASAQALARAKTMKDPLFLKTAYGDLIVVEKAEAQKIQNNP